MSMHPNREQNPAWKQLRRKIKELESKDYLPSEMVAVVSTVTELQFAARDTVRFGGLKEQVLPQTVLEKLTAADSRRLGAPLLPRRDFPLDLRSAAELAPALLKALPEKSPQLEALARELEQTLASDVSLLERACREILEEPAPEDTNAGGSCFRAWEQAHPEAPSLFRFVTQSAVMPSLAVAGKLLGETLDSNASWPHGLCPVCGSLPLMGRLEGREGVRLHTCSFCCHEYRVPRLGCAFCAEAPEAEAHYYSSEQEPGYLLEVCRACNTYIKLADFREHDRGWLPVLDDLASLALDLYARQMGFTRPTLSAWGF